MSGTSLDAVDAALVDIHQGQIKLLTTHRHALPTALRQNILSLCTPGDNEIERMGVCDVELGEVFANAVQQLLRNAQMNADQICAIGSHGQTIRHRPDQDHAFTLQIADPNIIAQRTGITTVADFRRRDMAAGGQGAPLAPILHQSLFSSTCDRAILNIGGMANLTLLPADTTKPVIGFDTGTGNVLMDAWCQQHEKGNYDDLGAWAASGTPDARLLTQLLTDPYFQRPPPKSTGREKFNCTWLQQQMAQMPSGLNAANVCATLLEFTLEPIRQSIEKHFRSCQEIYVCGGGAHNRYLLQRLAALLPQCLVSTTAQLGVDPDWVEAVAFALMAKNTLARQPSNICSITGAQQACILGGIYSA